MNSSENTARTHHQPGRASLGIGHGADETAADGVQRGAGAARGEGPDLNPAQ